MFATFYAQIIYNDHFLIFVQLLAMYKFLCTQVINYYQSSRYICCNCYTSYIYIT